MGSGVIGSLEKNDFADEVQCAEFLAIVGVATVFCCAFSRCPFIIISTL